MEIKPAISCANAVASTTDDFALLHLSQKSLGTPAYKVCYVRELDASDVIEVHEIRIEPRIAVRTRDVLCGGDEELVVALLFHAVKSYQ